MNVGFIIIDISDKKSNTMINDCLPYGSFGKSNMCLYDIWKKHPGVKTIILSDISPWNDDTTKWYVDNIYEEVLTTLVDETINIDAADYYIRQNEAKKLCDVLGVCCKHGDMFTQKNWWKGFLSTFYRKVEKPTPVEPFEPVSQKPIQIEPSETPENSEKLSKKEYKWNVESDGNLIKVPDGVISVQIHIKKGKLTFLRSNGSVMTLKQNHMSHIEYLSAAPYIWIGIPKDVEYIKCYNQVKYKFCEESQPIYRGVDVHSVLLPQNYIMIKNGKKIELIYSEDNKMHEPSVSEGMLIIGQS